MMLFNRKINDAKATTSAVNNFALSKKNALFLWLCQCLNIATIALELGTWMLAIITLTLTWQAFLLHRWTSHRFDTPHSSKQKAGKGDQRHKTVSPFILAVFAIFGCITIVITAPQHGLLISMVHLLCFSYVLKAFELKKRSDFYQVLLLGVFVLASALIFRQDLAFSTVIASLLIINFAVLLQYFSSINSFTRNIKVISVLLVQSAILAVVLFLVFPRLSPFWQVPIAKSAETGLSDTVKPGDIAKLSRSTKLAFRVSFEQQIMPTYSELYWRAMVLEDYDGNQWTKHRRNLKVKEKQVSIDVNSANIRQVTYQVLAEPSFQKYLFALAPAIALGPSTSDVIALADYTFLSNAIISQTKPYQLTSYLGAPLDIELDGHTKKVNLNYPKNSNPRLEHLASQLQQTYLEPQQRAQAVLNLINEENYAYTLQPPLLQNNSLDQFFFDTQAGFCEHYASAFTFLMRASGVPARMVTGYLGGEYNKSNTDENNGQGHLSIYQYDAHAWSEIWVEGKGWLRVDPTGAVDPQRINSGWSDQLLQQQSDLSNNLFSLYRFKNTPWLNALRLQFDALDYQWTRWVVGFSSKQQYNLLKSWFGNMAPWKLAVIIASALVFSMVLLLSILHIANRVNKTKPTLNIGEKLYFKALAQLAKLNIEKPPSMTVNDYAKEVREIAPELAISFTRLSASYNRLCYQNVSQTEKTALMVTMQQQYQHFFKKLKEQR